MQLLVNILNKQFAEHEPPVLTDIAFSVPEGSITCLYGQSGCGKSTCLRIIAGLDEQYSGVISLDGRNVSGPTQEIGMVVQRHVAYNWLTVAGNLTFGLRYTPHGQRRSAIRRFFGGLSDDYAAQEARRLATIVGLSESDLMKHPDQISGGMKQRMAFGRAILLQPKLLLLDEPFSSLDYESRQALQDAVLRVRDEMGTSFICVSHDPDEVLYLADEVKILGGTPTTVIRTYRPSLPFRGAAETRYTTEFQEAKKQIRAWLNDAT